MKVRWMIKSYDTSSDLSYQSGMDASEHYIYFCLCTNHSRSFHLEFVAGILGDHYRQRAYSRMGNVLIDLGYRKCVSPLLPLHGSDGV